MKRVGAHVSTAGGIEHAPLNAKEIDATAFGLFVRNQRSWKTAPLTQDSVESFKNNCAEAGFQPEHILPHVSYLINLGSPDKDLLARSRQTFIEELQRCERLGLSMLNFHPGAHKQEMSEEQCLDVIAESVNAALEQVHGVSAVIESTAGTGSHIGYRFSHLSGLIDRIEDKERVGVCLDTCHLFAAGYDLRTPEAYATTLAEFGRVIGFRYLRGMHLNDAKVELASRLDRHHSLGEGLLGWEAFRLIMNDARMDEIPLILETIKKERWAEEIRMLNELEGP